MLALNRLDRHQTLECNVMHESGLSKNEVLCTSTTFTAKNTALFFPVKKKLSLWTLQQTLIHFIYAQNTDKEINKLCSFLGLSVTPEVRQRITDKVHFDNMKNNKMANYSQFDAGGVMDFKVSPFLRKGNKSYLMKITVN